jgi:diguanylate cyclase
VDFIGFMDFRLAASRLATGGPLKRSYASETHNLKADALLPEWMGLIGVNLLPSIAMAMVVFITTMGAGGPRLCLAGVILMVVACLVTLQLTGIHYP